MAGLCSAVAFRRESLPLPVSRTGYRHLSAGHGYSGRGVSSRRRAGCGRTAPCSLCRVSARNWPPANGSGRCADRRPFAETTIGARRMARFADAYIVFAANIGNGAPSCIRRTDSFREHALILQRGRISRLGGIAERVRRRTGAFGTGPPIAFPSSTDASTCS